MKGVVSVLFLVCVALARDMPYSHRSRNKGQKLPEWNKLSATWLRWTEIPMTEREAYNDGWKLFKHRSDNKGYFKGSRYLLLDDTSLMLLFDSCGKISGVQLGMPSEPGTARPLPWVKEGTMYTVTAYFKNPNTICTKGRAKARSLGDCVWIQNGTGPMMNYFSVPLMEQHVNGTKWVKGQCFWSVGQLYWYNLSRDTNCDELFPLFLMYNDGRLNGIGWVVMETMNSSRFVQSTSHSFEFLFKNDTLPECLKTAGRISLQHLYFDENPYMNSC